MSAFSQQLLKKIEDQLLHTELWDQLTKKGQILEVKDGVAIIAGLENVMYSEIVLFEWGQKWLVFDLLQDSVGVLILGDYTLLKQWMIVTGTGKTFSVWVWEKYIGRVLNGLGEPMDEGGNINPSEFFPVEKIAPWVITRKSVDTPLQTGIKAIDAMVPIGRGQRELIIGDRQTGKTTVAIDTILNQKGKDVTCIYVAIWQKESKIARIVEWLRKKGAMDYTIVVNASINTPAVNQYLAPYVWCALWEWVMAQGKDALIIYDDLSKHAVAYREMALLLRRPPGREAYPGDVFYLHSRLLERAANLNSDFGGGSLTALPIIETQASDVSAYIPTNVISITDWQIYLETDLFNAGVKPAINVGLSVSRVWGSAQTGLMKKVAGKLRLELASYRELESFAQFGSDLDETTQAKLSRGKRLVEMLKQSENSPLEFHKQSILIYAGINGHIDELPVDQVQIFEQLIYEKMDTIYKAQALHIFQEKKLTEQTEQFFKEWIQEVKDELKNM